MTTEIARLQRDLEYSNWALDAVLQERDQWKRKFQRSEQVIFKLNGDSVRNINNLAHLQDETQYLHEEFVDQNNTINSICAKNANLEDQICAKNIELSELVVTFQRALAEKSGHSVVALDQREALHAQIVALQEHNKLLAATSHEDESCNEHTKRVLQQLRDACDLRAAAEAEKEALEHVEIQNMLLGQQQIVNKEQIAELLQIKTDLMCQVESMKISRPSGLSKHCETPALSLKDEFLANRSNPSSLRNSESSPISTRSTSSILYEYNSPENGPEVSLNIDHFEDQLPPSEISADRCKAPSLSDIQTVSIKPVAQNSSFSAKSALSIYGLSSPIARLSLSNIQATAITPASSVTPGISANKAGQAPASSVILTQNLEHQSPQSLAPKPNVAVTINIKPIERKGWGFLSYIQSAISETSDLDINGPTELVQTLINDMKFAEANQKNTAATSIHWQNVAKEGLVRVQALRNELYSRR